MYFARTGISHISIHFFSRTGIFEKFSKVTVLEIRCKFLQNTLTSGNYHSSLSGKCAKQLTGVCAPSFYYYQIEKKTTAETITAHSSPSKYSSPLLPKIIQLLPVQLLPALARAEI